MTRTGLAVVAVLLLAATSCSSSSGGAAKPTTIVPAGATAVQIAKLLKCPALPPDPDAIELSVAPTPATTLNCKDPVLGQLEIDTFKTHAELTAVVKLADAYAGSYGTLSYVIGDRWEVSLESGGSGGKLTKAQQARELAVAKAVQKRIGGQLRQSN